MSDQDDDIDDDGDDDRPQFSVYQFFPDGSYEPVLRWAYAKAAAEQAKRCVRSVGARQGTTVRVIITDGGDFTCWEWKHGQGVTYPPPGTEGVQRQR